MQDETSLSGTLTDVSQLLLFPFYRWRNWDSGSWGHLPRALQLPRHWLGSIWKRASGEIGSWAHWHVPPPPVLAPISPCPGGYLETQLQVIWLSLGTSDARLSNSRIPPSLNWIPLFCRWVRLRTRAPYSLIPERNVKLQIPWQIPSWASQPWISGLLLLHQWKWGLGLSWGLHTGTRQRPNTLPQLDLYLQGPSYSLNYVQLLFPFHTFFLFFPLPSSLLFYPRGIKIYLKYIQFEKIYITVLQYSHQDNPMDRGAWWATVHGGHRVRHDWVTNAHTHLLFHTCTSQNTNLMATSEP